MKAIISLLVPLFISAFKRAEDLAIAMEASGYQGGEGRTKFRQLRWKISDTVTIVSLLCLGLYFGMGAVVMENREMERIKCTVAYDGIHFCGYQIQPQQRTVQGEIEKALQKLHKGELVRVQASGRTDSTVHAKGQVIHFDTPLSS